MPNSLDKPAAASNPVNRDAAGDELVPHDDRAIAGAVRLSLFLAFCAAIAVWVTVWGIRVYHQKPQIPQKPITLPTPVPRSQENVPVTHFTDITANSGIHFVHTNGARGEKLLPEAMGGGVAFLDFDNDGKPDLLFVNSASRSASLYPLAGVNPKSPEASAPSLALYHNDGNGHFTDVTAGSGLDIPGIYGMGVAVGDYDNDGLVDILITGLGGCRLFHNEGNGHFRDVTVEAGVGGSPDDFSTSAAFIDYDNDGRLDLFVCNYIKWTREQDLAVSYTLTGIGRAYGPPKYFRGGYSRLYHNDGHGKFTDVSKAAGIQVNNKDTEFPLGKSLGVAPIDLSGDGLIDLVVANDTVQNFVFKNQGNGTFQEIGAQCGIGFAPNGLVRSSMGIDAGIFRSDGAVGIPVATLAHEMMGFYVSEPLGGGMPHFSDDAIAAGLGGPSRMPMKFSTLFLDYDLDGRLDLLCVNGHLDPDIEKMSPNEHYPQSAQLYWNTGGAGLTYTPAGPDRCGPDLFKPIVGRGCACADIDGDGDTDLVFTQLNGPPLLLRNDQRTGNHYLRLKLVGKKCNRDAIGARVTVRIKENLLQRQVMPTRGYLSQSELPVTVGLGQSTAPDSIEIKWPGGGVQKVTQYKVDGLTTIEQE